VGNWVAPGPVGLGCQLGKFGRWVGGRYIVDGGVARGELLDRLGQGLLELHRPLGVAGGVGALAGGLGTGGARGVGCLVLGVSNARTPTLKRALDSSSSGGDGGRVFWQEGWGRGGILLCQDLADGGGRLKGRIKERRGAGQGVLGWLGGLMSPVSQGAFVLGLRLWRSFSRWGWRLRGSGGWSHTKALARVRKLPGGGGMVMEIEGKCLALVLLVPEVYHLIQAVQALLGDGERLIGDVRIVLIAAAAEVALHGGPGGAAGDGLQQQAWHDALHEEDAGSAGDGGGAGDAEASGEDAGYAGRGFLGISVELAAVCPALGAEGDMHLLLVAHGLVQHGVDGAVLQGDGGEAVCFSLVDLTLHQCV